MESLNQRITQLASKKQEWKDLPLEKKLKYLIKIQDYAEKGFEEWSDASVQWRGLDANEHKELLGPIILGGPGAFGAQLVKLIDIYKNLISGKGHVVGNPEKRTYKEWDVVKVFPSTTFDSLQYPSYEGEIWMPKGQSGQKKMSEVGPALCGILGAGNYEAPIDILTKMFTENRVVVYKPNPVNEINHEFLKKMFEPLTNDGYLLIEVGGIDVGKAILSHPDVEEALMTGGAAAYDIIVWGADPAEREQNKQNNTPVFSKPFEAELGAVTPVIIVPGSWNRKEIDHHAAQIAAAKLYNGSHICCSPQLLVVDKKWEHREAFLERLKYYLNKQEAVCYYPGTANRLSKFKEVYGEKAQELGQPFKKKGKSTEKCVTTPTVFVPGVDLSNLEEKEKFGLKEEAFAPFLMEVLIDSGDEGVPGFLRKAVEFANSEQVFGSLSCTVIIDPSTEKANKEAFEDALANLEWGAIGVNVWGIFTLGCPPLPWGAYPKHTPQDVQSGLGKIGNIMLYEHPSKSVIRSSFLNMLHPHPSTFANVKLMKRNASFSIRPGWMKLATVASAATVGI